MFHQLGDRLQEWQKSQEPQQQSEYYGIDHEKKKHGQLKIFKTNNNNKH